MNKPAGKIAIFALILAMAAVSYGDFLSISAAGRAVDSRAGQSGAAYQASSTKTPSFSPPHEGETGRGGSDSTILSVAPSSASQYSLVVSEGTNFPSLRVVTLNFSNVDLAVVGSTGGNMRVVVAKATVWEKPETVSASGSQKPVGVLNEPVPVATVGSSKFGVVAAVTRADKDNFSSQNISNFIRSVELRC